MVLRMNKCLNNEPFQLPYLFSHSFIHFVLLELHQAFYRSLSLFRYCITSAATRVKGKHATPFGSVLPFLLNELYLPPLLPRSAAAVIKQLFQHPNTTRSVY